MVSRESLPRWAFGCWWRRDGVPIWTDTSLIADETVNYGYGGGRRETLHHDARRRPRDLPAACHSRVRRRLALSLAERRLPVNVDPLKSELKDEAERARLSRIFEQGLGHVVGYVLPLRRTHEPDSARVGEQCLVSALRPPVSGSR
jgi:uncharacterized protein (DUF2126 family)